MPFAIIGGMEVVTMTTSDVASDDINGIKT